MSGLPGSQDHTSSPVLPDRPTHGWCPTCEEESAIDSERRCLWCGDATEQRKPKKRGGWKRPDLAGSRYTESQLRALHIFHTRDGVSINQLAKRSYRVVGYKSAHGAAVAISREWKRLRLQARGRIEQTVLSSTKHGRKRRNQSSADERAYRRWLATQRGWRSQQGPGQPACEGVRKQPPRKGEPCQRPAKTGSRFCAQHDPAMDLRWRTHLAKMRAQREQKLREEALPMAPFAAYVKRRWDELGTFVATAERLGLHVSAVSTYARGLGSNKKPKLTIQRTTVERILECDGLSIEDVYEAGLEELAA